MAVPVLFLFDVDGTLVRTDGAGVRAFNRGFFEIMGWSDALSTFSPAGMTDIGIAQRVSRWYRGTELSPEEMEKVFRCYLDHLSRELEQTSGYRVLPGIHDFLEQQNGNSKILLGLGTGNLEEGAYLKLEHGKIRKYFRIGGFGSDASDRAELLRIAVRRAEKLTGASIPPERVVVIGDTPLDIQAGKAIGAKTLAVATGSCSVRQLTAHEPDLAIADFSDCQAVNRFLEKCQ